MKRDFSLFSLEARKDHLLYQWSGFKEALPLGLILCLASILRFWGISFGLPYAYHWDELAVVNKVINIAKGHPNPNWFFYPTGHMYLQAFALDVLFLVGKSAGWWHSTVQFQTLFHTDPTKIFLVIRALSVLLGIGTVLIVYQLTKRLSSSPAPIVAAALTAVCPLLVRDSHFGVMDVPASFWCTVTLYVLVMYIQVGKKKVGYLAAICMGLAIGTKWTAAFLLPALFYAHYCATPSRRKSVLSYLILLSICLVSCFAVSPFAFIHWKMLIAQLHLQRIIAHQAFAPWQPAAPVYLLGYGLPCAMGWLATVLALLGSVQIVTRKHQGGTLLVLYVSTFILGIVGERGVFFRYLDIILPSVAILATLGIKSLWDLLRTIFSFRAGSGSLVWKEKLFLSSVATLVISPLLFSDLNTDRLMCRTDTRTSAKAWIETHIPTGSVIGSTSLWADPPLVSAAMAHWFQPSQKTYDVLTLSTLNGIAVPAFIARQHVQYIITTSYPGYERKGGLTPPALFKHLASAHIQPQQEFGPTVRRPEMTPVLEEEDTWYVPFGNGTQVDRPGPDITIWKVMP